MTNILLKALFNLQEGKKYPQMVIIKKPKDNKCWQGCGEIGTLAYCWWEYKIMQPVWKTVWRFLKKLKIVLSYDPAILLLGVYLKELKSSS